VNLQVENMLVWPALNYAAFLVGQRTNTSSDLFDFVIMRWQGEGLENEIGFYMECFSLNKLRR